MRQAIAIVVLGIGLIASQCLLIHAERQNDKAHIAITALLAADARLKAAADQLQTECRKLNALVK